MNIKLIVIRMAQLGQSGLRIIKQVLLLPRSISVVVKNRRQQIAHHAAEAERLDRIRNPSDYLGK